MLPDNRYSAIPGLSVDTGLKMKADTSKHQKKKDVALFTAGTIGYLAIKNSDYVGMIHNNLSKIEYQQQNLLIVIVLDY